LFAPGKDALVMYNMMFPRWSEDPRAGAPGGQDGPAAACPSSRARHAPLSSTGSTVLLLTSPSGSTLSWSRRQTRSARHLRTGPRLAQYAAAVLAEEHLQPRLSWGNGGGRAASPVSECVLPRRGRIHHTWASELTFAAATNSPSTAIWPIWGVLDLTRTDAETRLPTLAAI